MFTSPIFTLVVYQIMMVCGVGVTSILVDVAAEMHIVSILQRRLPPVMAERHIRRCRSALRVFVGLSLATLVGGTVLLWAPLVKPL